MAQYLLRQIPACIRKYLDMGWLRSVGSIKLYVSFAEYRLFYRSLLQKRPIILSILLTKATPYLCIRINAYVHLCTYIYISICTYTHICMYAYVYISLRTCRNTRVAFMYIFIYMYMKQIYVYISICA